MTGDDRDVVQIRMPRTALIAVGGFAICVLPLASARPWLAVLWLPLLAAASGGRLPDPSIDPDRPDPA